MGCHFLCQGIFPTQRSNLSLLNFRQNLYHLSYQGSSNPKTIALTVENFVGTVMSLLFNMLSRFVITFLPRSKHHLTAAATIHSDLWAQENKICHCFHFSPFCLPWSDELDVTILDFWMLNFKPAFSASSFTLIKRLFNCSSLSDIRVVSSAYLRLLIFFLAILIPAYDSFSLMFSIMYSAYKLNKQGENIV